MEGRRLTDAELTALGALVQADAIEIDCENKWGLAHAKSVARVNNESLGFVPSRSVYDMPSYQLLVAELRKREVLR